MRYTYISKMQSALSFVLPVLILLLLANGGKDPQPMISAAGMLYVAQDEKQLEKDIAAYIQQAHGVRAELGIFRQNPDDVYLRYSLEPKDAPVMNLTVDTRMSNKNEDGKITERSIRFYAFYVLPDKAKTPEARRKLLELNNSWEAENWMPDRIYLDSEGDIAMETIINIPGEKIPLHGEMCFDVIARMSNAWSQYYRQLKQLHIKLK